MDLEIILIVVIAAAVLLLGGYLIAKKGKDTHETSIEYHENVETEEKEENSNDDMENKVKYFENKWMKIPVGYNGKKCYNNNYFNVYLNQQNLQYNDNTDASLNLSIDDKKDNFFEEIINFPKRYFDVTSKDCKTVSNINELLQFSKPMKVSVSKTHPYAIWNSIGKPAPFDGKYYFMQNGMYKVGPGYNIELVGTTVENTLTTMVSDKCYKINTQKAKIYQYARCNGFQRSIILTLNDDSNNNEIWDYYTPIKMNSEETIINFKTYSIKINKLIKPTKILYNNGSDEKLPYNEKLPCFYNHSEHIYPERKGNLYLYFINNDVPYETGIDYYYDNFMQLLSNIFKHNYLEILYKQKDDKNDIWKPIDEHIKEEIIKEYAERCDFVESYLIEQN